MEDKQRIEAQILQDNWQHFFASIVIAVLFPLLPVGIELFLRGNVSEQSILIAAIMYCSAVSIVSESVLVLVMGFITAILLSIPYGILLHDSSSNNVGSSIYALFAMTAFGIAHILQRYNQHVVRGEDFIQIKGASK